MKTKLLRYKHASSTLTANVPPKTLHLIRLQAAPKTQANLQGSSDSVCATSNAMLTPKGIEMDQHPASADQ